MAVTSSYKAKELTFMRILLRWKTREKEETLWEKTLYKGDVKSDTLNKMKSRCRKNGSQMEVKSET